MHSGGPDADPATVEFRKTRAFPECQLHEVTFVDRRGQSMEYLVRTWQDRDGTWRAGPVGGGAGSSHPHRRRPWVNFAAGWGTDGFAAGGWVIGEGSEAARVVRLTFGDGMEVEDTVDREVVLFFVPGGVVFPADVEILDRGSGVLAVYRDFEGLGAG